MNDTKAVGVRVQMDLLNRAKLLNPDFNLSMFVRAALIKEYGDIDDKIDELLKLKH